MIFWKTKVSESPPRASDGITTVLSLGDSIGSPIEIRCVVGTGVDNGVRLGGSIGRILNDGRGSIILEVRRDIGLWSRGVNQT